MWEFSFDDPPIPLGVVLYLTHEKMVGFSVRLVFGNRVGLTKIRPFAADCLQFFLAFTNIQVAAG